MEVLLIVIRLGFEPKTHSLEGCCSIQLSYQTILIGCKITNNFQVGTEFLQKNAKTTSLCFGFRNIRMMWTLRTSGRFRLWRCCLRA